jgi:hypothetical protein
MLVYCDRSGWGRLVVAGSAAAAGVSAAASAAPERGGLPAAACHGDDRARTAISRQAAGAGVLMVVFLESMVAGVRKGFSIQEGGEDFDQSRET